MAQDLTDDLIIVKNICKDDEKKPTSPVSCRKDNQSSEFVVLSSTLINSIDCNNYLVSTANSSKTFESVKDVASMSMKSSESPDEKSLDIKSNVEDVELVLVPRVDGSSKIEGGSVQSNASRNSDTDLDKSHATPSMMNKVNVQQNIQNKPVMVSTKKFMQDVMQTTAKVSIGNTTISVPLLKPLNSKQLLNSGFSLDSQSKTHSIKYQQTATQPKTQLNLGKILNIKRNQKGVNQPTIVSLSQLQIKPVSNAKIVQAKVLSKKIPLQLQVSSSMPTSMSTASVTQIPAKSKQNITRNVMTNIGPVNIHNISAAVEAEKSLNMNDVDSSQHTAAIEYNTSQQLAETMQKSVPNSITNKSTISFSAISQDKSKSLTTTTVKKICQNEGPTPPSLTPLGGKYTIEQKSQQSAIGISTGGVSIVKQNVPQTMITTPALNTAICSTSLISEFSTRTEILSNNKQAVVRNKANSKVNTITFPKNISLMLTKTTVPQQQAKTPAGNKTSDATSIGIVSSKIERNKGNNNSLSVSTSIKNVQDVSSNNTSVALSSEHLLFSATHNDNSSENQVQSSTLEHQPTIKRLKLSNDDEDDYGTPTTATTIQLSTTKKQILKISSAKAPSSGELECDMENTDDMKKKQCTDADVKLTTMLDGDKINNNQQTNHYSNMSSNTNVITVPPKTEETHNVLLKQLLQNCPNIPNTNQTLGSSTTTNIVANNSENNGSGGICSQVLPPNRKVTNMRAPSLGLVSSLEAQLARPVIPPVPTGTTTSIHRQNEKHEKVLIFVPTDCTNNTAANKIPLNKNSSTTSSESILSNKDGKLKSPTHIISKETSFVSNPSGVFGGNKHEDISAVDVNTNNATINGSNNENRDVSKNTDVYTLNVTNQATNIVPDLKVYRVNATERLPENGTTTSKGSSGTTSILQPSKNVPIIGIEDVARKEKPTKINNDNEDNSTLTNTKVATKINRNLLLNTNEPRLAKNLEDDKIKKDINAKQKSIEIFGANPIPPPTVEIPATEQPLNVGLSGTTPEKLNNPIVKDTDLRKKRKREYQKQRRQMLSNNKEQPQQAALPVTSGTVSASAVSNAKRRPRKISKIEEDYDSFIDNLMVKMRQMPPLEVQEPLLSKNISMSYEKQMAIRPILNKTIDSLSENSMYAGDYGRVKHTLNNGGIYDINDGGGFSNTVGKNQSAIQNDFYDQEFVPVMYKNESDKVTKYISVIKERNIEVLSTINNSTERDDTSKTEQKFQNMCSGMPYPGLILANKSNNDNLGRMSPIVHIVKPSFKKRIAPTYFQSVGTHKQHCLTGVKNENKDHEILDTNFSKTNACNRKDSTVAVSLHLLSSENVLSILRDLANILNISPLTNYKLFKQNPEEKLLPYAVDDNAPHHSKWGKKVTYSNLQKIICGKLKLCITCGNIIQSVGIRLVDTNGPKLKCLQDIQFGARSKLRNSNIIYFCNTHCYKQYKPNTENSSDRRVAETPTNIDIKSGHPTNEEQKSNLEPNKSNNSSAKKSCFKYFNVDSVKPVMPVKNNSDKDLMDMLLRLDITVTARNSLPKLKGNAKLEEDTRQCNLCSLHGDGLSDGASRLLNFEVDKWVHLNCALWSNGVYETVSGGLMNLQTALHLGMNQTCSVCHALGATVKCFKTRCGAVFHLPCAIKSQCVFYKNKTIQCAQHASRTEKENELTSLTVHRRVFVERDENCQVAAVMHHHTEQNNLLRVGSLTFLNVGQLLPHQLEAFHTTNHIYPIGYKIVRLYWSMKRLNKRCRYLCSIAEVAGRPEFRIQVQESLESDIEFSDTTPNAVWRRILDKIHILRKDTDMVRLFPKFITGEDLFGLTEPTIVRIIESLPGIENLTDYRFKYGRNPLLELPLAVNPSGSARTEPKQRQLLGWRKPHTQRSATTFNQRTTNTASAIAGEIACPYSKQFVHSKSSQYKKMKQEWRNNVYLARSKIQGLGLYAARDIEKHTMIIEYIGEVIRTEVSELREKQYEAKNRGIYMFRLDEDRVVDATLSGGLARYINHSCNPNCVTETVEVDRELRIIIFAKRRINRSEELSYDYKFDIEDDANKIPCMCGTPNCRKWMN